MSAFARALNVEMRRALHRAAELQRTGGVR